MDETIRSFRDDLEAKLADIESVLRSAHLEPGRRDGAVRRLARLLGASAHAHGLPEITRAADEVERAVPFAMPMAAERLLVVLRRVVSDPAVRRTFVLVLAADGARRQAIMAALARPERELIAVGGLAEAEQALRTRELGVVVAELGSSGAGEEAMRFLTRLRSRSRGALLPLIALCGPDDQALAFERGADACVVAPESDAAISAAVDAALRRSAQLRAIVRKDPLTGLLNRAGLLEAFARRIAACARSGEVLSLAVIEIDESNVIEEVHGQLAVDEALKHTATILTNVLRRDDLLASWEEDRLIALLTGGTDGAVRALQKGLKALRAHALEVRSLSAIVPCTFSAGIAEAAAPAALDEVVAEADRRLWLARSAGKPGIHADIAEPTTRQRILVALSDAPRAGEVTHRLSRDGFEVVRELDGAGALKTARGQDIALCILDSKLPVRDGFQVLERLRRGPVSSRVPVLLIMSGGREGEASRGFELGADDQVTTPYSMTELLARVHRLLKRRVRPSQKYDPKGGSVVGEFSGDQLFEYVQMLGVSVKTGIVRIACDTFSGSLYIDGGRLVGASTSIGSPAIEAAFEVILTPHGRFNYEPGLPLGVRRDLSMSLEAFLLEAVRRRDEGRRRQSGG